MKFYTQFTRVQNNKEQDILGDRGVFVLDGRNGIDTMVHDSIIAGMKRDIDGFKIIKSERFTNDGNVVYSWLRSGSIK